jgi:hypothetical protein
LRRDTAQYSSAGLLLVVVNRIVLGRARSGNIVSIGCTALDILVLGVLPGSSRLRHEQLGSCNMAQDFKWIPSAADATKDLFSLGQWAVEQGVVEPPELCVFLRELFVLAFQGVRPCCIGFDVVYTVFVSPGAGLASRSDAVALASAVNEVPWPKKRYSHLYTEPPTTSTCYVDHATFRLGDLCIRQSLGRWCCF